MYSEQIEQLIKSVIADGVVTEKERAVLHKRAAAEGIDEDEIDVYVDGLLTQKKAETPQNASIDYNYIDKYVYNSSVYYYGQKLYCIGNIPKCPVDSLYLRFFKEVRKDTYKGQPLPIKIYIGVSVISYVNKIGIRNYYISSPLSFKTGTNSINLKERSIFKSEIPLPSSLSGLFQKGSVLSKDFYFDEEMLKLLCDAKQITMSLLGCSVTKDSADWDVQQANKRKYDIKDISVDYLATYAQVFYRSVVDNSAYPDAVIIENESPKAVKSDKENYDVSDVDDDMVIRLLTEDTNKWEKIKPRPGIIDQYKGLKGITITDIHFSADCGGEDKHLELKALSDKNSNYRFFFVYKGGWWRLQKDLKLTVNLEDHELRYLQHKKNYIYEVEASVLQEIFTTKHDIKLDDRELKSVPQSSWKKGFDYLTDSNKMKEWLDKYEENKESGIFGKIKNLFG